MNLVLLFHTAAPAERAVRVHLDTCTMLRTAKRGGVVKQMPYSQEEADDLTERGFPVRFCKCTKTER